MTKSATSGALRGRPVVRECSRSTVKNRLYLLRKQCGLAKNCECVQHKYKLRYGTEVPTKATKRVRQPGDKRRRAAPATRAQLIEALLSKSKSGTTSRDVKKIKEKTGVYKDGAIRLQKEIPFP